MKRGLKAKQLAFLLVVVVLASSAFVSADAGKVFVLKVEAGSVSGAYAGLGEFLYKAGFKGEAEKAFLKSAQLQDSSLARHNLGIIYYELNDIANAEANFRAAVRLDEGNARARNSLAVFLFRQGSLGEAAQNFRAAARLQPDNVQAHFDLGVSLANNVRDGHGTYDDLVEAYGEFKAASLIDPSYPNAVSNAEAIAGILAEQ